MARKRRSNGKRSTPRGAQRLERDIKRVSKAVTRPLRRLLK